MAVNKKMPEIKEDNKQKALETALSQIKKNYGEGAVMRLGENRTMNVAAISTGSIALDAATGIGGLPRGRLIEIYGPAASGQATLARHVVAQAQKAGGEAAFIDAEHALDPVYAEKIGVDINSLLVSQPDDGEQALEIAEALVRSGAIDVMVIDSVAALVPRAEIEGDMGDSHMGQHARLMSQALRKLAGAVSKTGTIIIFINQLREKIGVMFGNPETTTGGRALKFYATMRMDVRRIETIKAAGNEFVGARTRVKIVKNKVAPPFKEAEFDIMFGEGISHIGEVIDLGVKLDVIRKSGAWFYYGEQRLAQGRDNVKDLLANDSALCAEIEAKIQADKDRIAQVNKTAKKGKDKSSEPAAAEPAPVPTTKEEAKSKLDIAVDDD